MELKDREKGELEGVVTDGKTVAVIRNDLSKGSHAITGYSVSSGKRTWSRSAPGWLQCSHTSPVVCQTTDYQDGEPMVSDASVLDIAKGKLRDFGLGRNGKFQFAGVHDGLAYFLTWQGTEDVHMTGFDANGAPVADKNLGIASPNDADDGPGIEVDMSGPFAAVRTKSGSGVYVAGRNGYGELDIAGSCAAVRDGAVCQTEEGLMGVGADSKKRWSIDADVRVVPSADVADVTLAKAEALAKGSFALSLGPASDSRGKHVPMGDATHGRFSLAGTPIDAAGKDGGKSGRTPTGKTASPRKTTPGRSSGSGSPSTPTNGSAPTNGSTADEERFLVSLSKTPAAVEKSKTGDLTLPAKRTVSLGSAKLVDFDLSHDLAVVNVENAASSSGESGGAAVASSMLVGENGKVVASLDGARLSELLKGASSGDVVRPFTFAWHGDALIFFDAVDGVVGVYGEAK